MIIEEKENNNIKIKGIKVNNDDLLNDVIYPLPSHNFFSLICGSPGSGKTSLLLNLIKKYYKKKFDRIYFYSGSLNTIEDEFLNKLNKNRIHDTLENIEEDIKDIKESDDKTLIIIDDLIREFKNKNISNSVMNLVVNRRHIGGGCRIFLITQKISSIPLLVRTHIDSIFYFNFNNKRETNQLFEDYINDLDKQEFNDLIKFAIDKQEKHSFLYISRYHNKYFYKFNELIFK